MNRLGNFIIALAIRNSMGKMFGERQRKRSVDEVKSVA
jgi:hypothetical protein